MEGDTQEPSNAESSDGTSGLKQNEHDDMEASMEEAKQNGQAEPAEVAAAEETAAGTSKEARRDDAGKGWGPFQRLYCGVNRPRRYKHNGHTTADKVSVN